jgi:ABC-2 type transport system ATP-binding protein
VAVFKSRLRVVDTPGRLKRQVYGRQVVFHLGNPAAPFLDHLRAMAPVKEVEANEGKLIATLDDPETHNPDIIRALVAAGADIQFVGEVRYSLEDVYLQLVKEDTPPAA